MLSSEKKFIRTAKTMSKEGIKKTGEYQMKVLLKQMLVPNQKLSRLRFIIIESIAAGVFLLLLTKLSMNSLLLGAPFFYMFMVVSINRFRDVLSTFNNVWLIYIITNLSLFFLGAVPILGLFLLLVPGESYFAAKNEQNKVSLKLEMIIGKYFTGSKAKEA